MKSPEPDPNKKAQTNEESLPSSTIIDPSKVPTKKIDPQEASKGRLTAAREDRETTDQDPRANNPTEFNIDKETSEQDKTLADIAEQISLAQAAILQEENEIKKGRKRKEILESGKLFQSKYEIIRMIGSGGMGQVYVANHTTLGSKVAIKVLNPNFIDDYDDDSADRFKREAKATASIDHPNAVKVFDFGVENNICYLVMEYLNGESLRKRLSRLNRFSIPEVINLVEQVCSVLEVVHRKGIVHRDLKPDNIFFHKQEDREILKVLDFGIAKVSGSTLSEGKLTSTGALLGTPHYMSPEQCQGMKLDGRSDLYSFGIIVYELLSGTLPFEAENTLSMLFKHVRDNPLYIKKIVPDLPQAIADIVMKSLEKDPKKRYQTAKEFAQAFNQAFESSKAVTHTNLALLESSNSMDLEVLTTVETIILPKVETSKENSQDSENKENKENKEDKENQEDKQYDVSTKNYQASATKPIGRPILNQINDITSNENRSKDISKNLDQKVANISNRGLKQSLVLSISAVAIIIAIFSAWRMFSNTNLSQGVIPSPIATNQATPELKATLRDFALISGGKITIGSDEETCDSFIGCKIGEFERPSHIITLSPYYLSKYEVTNIEYYEFIVETGHDIPPGWDKKQKKFPIGTEKLPVTQITWQEAKDYCQWRSKRDGINFRLPSEAEWEYAARGDDPRLFPWGNNWDPSLVNGAKAADIVNTPSSIDLAPNNTSDISPHKIYALAGNVAEWTDSNFTLYPNSKFKASESDFQCKIIRGGAFNTKANQLRTTSRSWDLPTFKDKNLGFRLAVTP